MNTKKFVRRGKGNGGGIERDRRRMGRVLTSKEHSLALLGGEREAPFTGPVLKAVQSPLDSALGPCQSRRVKPKR